MGPSGVNNVPIGNQKSMSAPTATTSVSAKPAVKKASKGPAQPELPVSIAKVPENPKTATPPAAPPAKFDGSSKDAGGNDKISSFV